jgi:hypothetical protein
MDETPDFPAPSEPRTTAEAFTEALRADVVIPDVAPKGPLSIGQMLSLRGWFDRRRSDNG